MSVFTSPPNFRNRNSPGERHFLTASGLVSGLILVGWGWHTARGQDAGAPQAQGPVAAPAIESKVTKDAIPPGTVCSAFLGVCFCRIPASVLHQTPKLKAGGLMIDELYPDSPAARAGLQRFDLLHKADGQIIFLAEQFIGLIRNKKPGETLTMTIFRHGQPQELTAKLGESPVTDNPAPPGYSLLARQEASRDLAQFLEKNPKVAQFYPELVHDLLTHVPQESGSSSSGGGILQETATLLQYSDADGSIEIRSEKGTTHVAIETPEGARIFSGATSLEKPNASIPEVFRDKVASLLKRRLSLPGSP